MNVLASGENSIATTKSLKKKLVCDEILILIDILQELTSLQKHQKYIFAFQAQSNQQINKTLAIQTQKIKKTMQLAISSSNLYRQTIEIRDQQKSLEKEFFKKIMRCYEDKIQNLKIRLEMEEIQIQNLQIIPNQQVEYQLDNILQFSDHSEYTNHYFKELNQKQLIVSKFKSKTHLDRKYKLNIMQILRFILLKQKILEESYIRELLKIEKLERKYQSQKTILREALKEAHKAINRANLTYAFDEQKTKEDYESFLKCLRKDILMFYSSSSLSYFTKTRKRSKSCHAIVKSNKACILSQKIIQTQSQFSFLEDCLHFVSEKFIVSDILDHQY